MRSAALLFTTLFASVLAGPTGNRESCSLHCNAENDFYQPGHSYEYQYEIVTSTSLSDSPLTSGSQMTIKTQAHIDVLAPCEYTLRLTDVTLEGSSHSQEMAAALTRSPLRFSFQDGRVEELCAAVEEPAWVLNMKRGVLSAFQTSVTKPGKEDVHERDVLGVCLTHYNNILEGDVLTVNKEKEISSCTKHSDLSSYIASTSYTSDSPLQSLPVLDSTSRCSQKVEKGVMIDGRCEEKHSFQPFSIGGSGATTNVSTHLRLASRHPTAPSTPDYRFVRRTTDFQTEIESSVQTQIETVNSLLTKLDEVSHEDVRSDAPKLFTELVIALRGLDYPVLSNVYTTTTETHRRKFLVDAMPLVGTAAAAAVVRDMSVNGDLTKEETDAWFTSLTFLKHPTSDMFTAIAPMLDTNPSESAMLGASALINTFCKIDSTCGDDSGVQQVIRRIETQLGSSCRATNKDQKFNILVALKALGNAGRWVNANRVLQRCYTENNDMEVRVAAIEAWRHTPCEYDRSNLLAAYQDEIQDPEVRIAAYLSVITCPTPATVAIIKDRLTSEGVNQVGSFVWTHLTNLQESAAPGKEWARVLLGEELLVNKFRTEALKFSRNYESSFFMKEFNFGAAVESNVIFSSKSYLPRSAMLNLTVDLFGESVNLFEVGGRIEGFETYLERLFGPDGYYPDETVAGVLRGLRQQKPEAEATTLEQFLERATDEPHGSYYLRLFGNDIQYRQFTGVECNNAAPSPFALLMELARGGNVDYTKSYQLLDTQYSVPTVSGLPLTLGVKSSAMLALRMDGSFNVQSLNNVHIEGHVRPSAAVHVDGEMLVDAHVTRTGVKVSSTLHTSTALDGKVHIEGGALVEVEINTPKNKIEIMDLKTKFFHVQDDQEVEQTPSLSEHAACTSGLTGMALCTQVTSPSVYPYSQYPPNAQVYLRKVDTQTGYQFRFTKSSNDVTISLDNPGAEHSRKMSFAAHKEDQRLTLRMNTFFINAEASGEYQWMPETKSLKLDIVKDSELTFHLDTGLSTTFSDEIKVEPHLTLTMQEENVIDTRVTLLGQPRQNKYSIDFLLNAEPYFIPLVTLKATYEGSAGRHVAGLDFKHWPLDMSSDAKLTFDDSTLKMDVGIDYSVFRSKKSHASSVLILEKQHEGDTNTYSANLAINMPDDDEPINLDYKFTYGLTEFNTNARLSYGSKVFDVEEKWSHTLENNVRRIVGIADTKCDFLEHHQSSFIEMVIGPNSFNLDTKIDSKERGVYTKKSATIELQRIPGNGYTARVDVDNAVKYSANAEFRRIEPGHYIAQTKATTTDVYKGEQTFFDLDAFYKDNSAPGKYDISTKGAITLPYHTLEVETVVYGEPRRAHINLQTAHNDRRYGMTIEANPTSILIDANIVRHIVVNADVNYEGAAEKSVVVNVEWDKEINADNVFKIEGKMRSNYVQANYKFLDQQFNMEGRLVSDGVEVELFWTPNDQHIKATLNYSVGAASSLTANLETTFPGWEKQSLDINTSLTPNEVNCRASATWRNSQQATLVITGGVQSFESLRAEVTFTSTIPNMDKFTLTLDHKMTGITIDSNVLASWNNHQINGSFMVKPTDTGLSGRAAFTSPFTQSFEAVLNHKLQDSSMDSSMVATYGSTQLLALTTQGHFSLGPAQHEVDLMLQLTTAEEVVSNTKASIKYSMDDSTLRLEVDGKVGEKKIMLTIQGDKTVTADSTTVAGNLRFLTPFTKPLTAMVSHKHNGQSFTSQFEISRIWSTYSFGTLKMHAEGHFLSRDDINLSAYISSPETKGSFSLVHKIRNNELNTVTKVYVNKEVISVTFNGTFDLAGHLVNLEGDISSSFEDINMKVMVDSKRNGDTQNTQVDISRNDQHATLTHSFTFTDILNWENTFTFNDIYSIKNKMTHNGNQYGHKIETKWNEKQATIDALLNAELNAESRKLDGHLIIETPYEIIQNNKLDFTYEEDAQSNKVVVNMEYKPEHNINLSVTNRCDYDTEFSSTASLNTPFWQTLGYDLHMTFGPQQTINCTFTHGQSTAVNLSGEYQPGRINFHVNLNTPSLTYPLGLEGTYDFRNSTQSVSLAVIYDYKYEATATFSGHLLRGAWSLGLFKHSMVSGEWRSVTNTEIHWEHQLETMPFSINAVFKKNADVYETSIKVDETSFASSIVLNGQEGNLNAKWLLQPTMGNISILFKSPVAEFISDFNTTLMYDINAMKGQVTIKYSTYEFDIIVKKEEETYILEGKTPFTGWETLGGSFFASTTAINAYVSRNERKIEVTGTQHLRPNKGKLELTVTTPYAGFETISFDASYNFLSANKTVKLKLIYGTSEIFAKGVVKLNDPSIILNITTPFSEIRTLRATASWDLNSNVKTAAVKVVYNEQELTWNMEASLVDNIQRVMAKATTPLPGWTDVSMETSFDVSESPYEIRITVQKEGIVQDYHGKLMLADNTIRAELTTPISGMETVVLDGTYTSHSSIFTSTTRATIGQDIYNFSIDIQTSKLKVAVTTPFADFEIMKLEVEGNFVEPQKSISVTLTKNDMTFTVNANYKLERKTGNFALKVESPIPGYSSLEVQGSYDFLNDVKICEMNVTKEGHKQHFAITATLDNNHMVVDMATPFPGFQVMKMDADYTNTVPGQHLVVASFAKDNEKYTFRGDVEVGDTSVVVRLITPIEPISRLVLDARSQIVNNIYQASIRFEKNEEVFNAHTELKFSPNASTFLIDASTPVAGWNNQSFIFKYKLQPNKFNAETSVKKDSFQKELSIEAEYGQERGNIKIKTPIVNWEELGAEYQLTITGGNEAVAYVKVSGANREFAFSAKGHYTSESISLSFQTPFQGYEESSLKANINPATRNAKVNLHVGPYSFSANGSYVTGDMFLEVTTSFPALRFGSIAIKHQATNTGFEALLKVIYNENNYFLMGEANLSPRTSTFVFQTKTPFLILQNATLKFKYNLDNENELLTAQVSVDNTTYNLNVSGKIEERLINLKIEMNSPVTGWTQVKFEGKVDLTKEDKALELVLEREDNIKAITIYGKVIGSALNFDLRTPFAGLNHFNMSGNFNRARRSVEMQMMNDAGRASILANFNSLKIDVKTPFARSEEVKFEIKKEENGYSGSWRRNNNYINVEVVENEAENTVNVEVKSELQGWELLALVGRIDHQTKQAYISGQRNERKIELTVSGQRNDIKNTRNYSLDLKTPYDYYQHVTGQFRFSPRRRSIKVESNSSPFKIDMKSSRRTGMELQVFVPNPTQNTELKVVLKSDNGNIAFTSRFPLLRSLNFNYALTLGDSIEMTQKLEINGMEVFTMEFGANPMSNMLHLNIHGRRTDRHINLHIHREGFNTFNIILKREVTEGGITSEKQLSVEMSGTGDLPTHGTIDATITNTFAEIPRTSTVHCEIDRRTSPKHVKLEVTLPGSKLFIFDVRYNINLLDLSKGDFNVRITTPDRKAAPWKNFSGNWEKTEGTQPMKFEFVIGGKTYRGEGRITLRQTDLEFTVNGIEEKFLLQWKFHRTGNDRDYYIKVGRESSYFMAKLKGTITLENGNVEGGFKSRFLPYEVLLSSSWTLNRGNSFTGQGDFSFGPYHGTHKLNFNRNAAAKSATFEFAVNSNHPDYGNVLISGNYDVLHKFVFNTEMNVGETIGRVKINITDLNPQQSSNSIEAFIPFVQPEFQTFKLTLTHDFRNQDRKQIIAESRIGERESYLRANWRRGNDFSIQEGNLDINSIFIGEVHISMKCNLSNIEDAEAEVHYKRVPIGQPEKRVDAKWSRKKTTDRLETEVSLDTTFEQLQHARAHATADFSDFFNLNAGLDYNDKHITITLNLGSDSLNMEVATPFEGFEHIKTTVNYNLKGKAQTVTLHYERGSNQIHLDIALNKKTKKSGDLKLELTTPFEIFRILKIEARWNKREATVEYLRNDVLVRMSGTAQLEANNSSFNLSFTEPGGRSVTIAAAYDVTDFISGTGTAPAKLASLTVDIEDTKAKIEVNGFRSRDRLYIEMEGESSFAKVRNLHLKVDSEFNTQERDGTFEFTLNDFVFEVHNHFETYDNGYYIKSRIETSLTPLPALVLGLGRRDDERIFTLGYGEEREFTFSIKAKDHFRSGFSGSVDIPNYGYDGVQYDVSYNFPSNDELEIDIKAQLGSDDHIEAEIEYNSDGVKARLTSPFTGERSFRFRRSINNDNFLTEVSADNYTLKLRGGFQESDIKRGLELEADIFGSVFLFNYLLQSEGYRYTEGKLIVQTPFHGFEKIGGMFTFSAIDQNVVGRAEMFIPIFAIPKITAAIDLELKEKIEGEVKLNIAGEQFSIRSILTGASFEEGCQVTVWLMTPFHVLPSLEVAGKIKVPSIMTLETDLKITSIYTTYEVHIAYELASPQKKFEFRIDNNYLKAECMIEASSFIMSVDTQYAGAQHQISVNTHYSTLQDLIGEVVAVIGDQSHKVRGALSIADTTVHGDLILDSSFIGDIRKLEFSVSLPDTSFTQISFSATLTATHTYAFSMELDTRSGVLANTKINTPALRNTTINLQLTWSHASVTVTTPTATHKATASWRQTRKMPADYILNMELDSPVLGERYALNMLVGGNRSKGVLKVELQIGNETHNFEANTVMSTTAGGISLNIQTPFRNIQTVTFRGTLDMSDVVQLETEATIREVTNKFIFVYNKQKGTLLVEANSPYLPTGTVKATSEINKSRNNTSLQISLMNASDVISGSVDVKYPTWNDITVRGILSTPVEGFETVNALIKYEKTDVTHLIFSFDNPITFKTEVKFANTSDRFSGKVTVKTSIPNIEYVEADIEIPLTEFAPRASITLPTSKYGFHANFSTDGYLKKAAATLFINDEVHGGNVSFRTRAPYELAYKYNIFETNGAFHLRTDSSFLTVFTPYTLLM